MGAAPARRAKAASDLMRPRCDQERMSCAAACGPTPGWLSRTDLLAGDGGAAGGRGGGGHQNCDERRQHEAASARTSRLALVGERMAPVHGVAVMR